MPGFEHSDTFDEQAPGHVLAAKAPSSTGRLVNGIGFKRHPSGLPEAFAHPALVKALN